MRTYSTTSGSDLSSSFDALSISSSTVLTPRVSSPSSSRRFSASSSSSSGDYEHVYAPSTSGSSRRESSSSGSTSSSGVMVSRQPSETSSNASGRPSSSPRTKIIRPKAKVNTPLPPSAGGSGNVQPSEHQAAEGSVNFTNSQGKGKGKGKAKVKVTPASIPGANNTPRQVITPTPATLRLPVPSSTPGTRGLVAYDTDSTSEEDFSDVKTVTGTSLGISTASRRITDDSEGSVMSSDDASTSIDSFLASTEEFVGDKANKLRLWQALCIELGLVEPANDLPDRPSYDRPASPTDTDKNPTQPTFDLPQTLTQARLLLKNHAHINIKDYLAEREQGVRKFDHLRFSSAKAMMKYTRKSGRWEHLGTVKGEWLEPLLKDFGRGRSRF